MATKRQLKKQDAMKAKTTIAATEATEKAADIKETTETKVAEVKKATEVKAAEVKKAVEEKAVEVKKATEEKVEEVKKAAAKAVSETKETVKKAAAKKPAAKPAAKKEVKTTIVVEYQEKQVDDKTMVAAVKKAWQKAGNKVGDIKTMTLYVKPEEDAVYYVINDTETGKAAF